ncbi:lipid asymmetry maintenance protein MlaB [Rhodanobacter umsongensis]|uniref:Lipid asymmetry maintenance protein MlaB n=1 Tax=Rhodanobacter umsongensis TaxID=633153 RepID=A0ABW0JM04_9GAMM
MAGKPAARHQGKNAPPAKASAAMPANAGEAAHLLLPADCRMAAQAALKAELLGALGAHAIVLDGGQVERVDTAALQLLVLFRRELDARGGTLGWHGTSDALNEAAGLLGLAQLLNLPAAALA